MNTNFRREKARVRVYGVIVATNENIYCQSFCSVSGRQISWEQATVQQWVRRTCVRRTLCLYKTSSYSLTETVPMRLLVSTLSFPVCGWSSARWRLCFVVDSVSRRVTTLLTTKSCHSSSTHQQLTCLLPLPRLRRHEAGAACYSAGLLWLFHSFGRLIISTSRRFCCASSPVAGRRYTPSIIGSQTILVWLSFVGNLRCIGDIGVPLFTGLDC